MADSPNAMSMAHFRHHYGEDAVWPAQFWNAHTRRRHDLCGFADLIVLAARERAIIAVQATSAPHAANRLEKILKLPQALLWLLTGNQIVVHGWRKKRAKPGGKAFIWHANTWNVIHSPGGHLDAVRVDKP